MRALVGKELREVFGIAAVALGCYLALVANLMGAKVFDWVPGMPRGTTGVPFLSEEWCALFQAEAATLPAVPGATAVNESTYRSADGSTTVSSGHRTSFAPASSARIISPVNTSNEKLAIWACAVSSRRRYARS